MRAQRPLRIGNISGFYGDRIAAPKELLRDAEVDVITGDYLAELTMFLLHKARSRDPEAGYATTFLRQAEEVLVDVAERGIRVVVNAGGLNPRGLAAKLEALVDRLGVNLKIAAVDGDDIRDRVETFVAEGERFVNIDTDQELASMTAPLVTAHAYLGGWGICAALEAGADIVVTGRVTDASLVVGPAAWWFGWGREDFDQLAGAVAAGHVIECGPQATGGNFAFFTELGGTTHPGFPIAEIEADGSSVITKAPNTGGQVTPETVIAQLLYEVGPPQYLGPDVITQLDSLQVAQIATDRVRICDVRGLPPTGRLKVAMCADGGYRNTMTVVLTGLDIEEKAAHAEAMLLDMLGGRDAFASFESQLIRFDRPDPTTQAQATAHLVISATDPDRSKVGRAFSNAIVELYLAGFPGLYLSSPPGDASQIGLYWPTTVDAARVPMRVWQAWDQTETVVPSEPSVQAPSSVLASDAAAGAPAADAAEAGGELADEATIQLPLGRVFGARSGDKGGNANVGLWARDDSAYEWLRGYLDASRFVELFPEVANYRVTRYDLPNMRAVNFVITGLLGAGVASSARMDPQAKALGEFVRARVVPIPARLAGAGGS